MCDVNVNINNSTIVSYTRWKIQMKEFIILKILMETTEI